MYVMGDFIFSDAAAAAGGRSPVFGPEKIYISTYSPLYILYSIIICTNIKLG